jgi:hypothetical protein
VCTTWDNPKIHDQDSEIHCCYIDVELIKEHKMRVGAYWLRQTHLGGSQDSHREFHHWKKGRQFYLVSESDFESWRGGSARERAREVVSSVHTLDAAITMH